MSYPIYPFLKIKNMNHVLINHKAPSSGALCMLKCNIVYAIFCEKFFKHPFSFLFYLYPNFHAE